jgi:hypothetical protein
MKIRKLLAAAFLCLLVMSCNKEKEILPLDDNDALSVNENTEEVIKKEIMYVSSPEGLRVREAPSFDSDKISLLSHLQPVVVLGKEEAEHTINYINGNWYLIESGDTTGWVFSGYLRNNAAAAEKSETKAGKYHYSGIAVQRQEYRNPASIIEHHKNVYFTLTRENNTENRYIFANNYPGNNYSSRPRSVTVYDDSTGAFDESLGERGGAYTLCQFYYRDNAIVMYIDDEATYITGQEIAELAEGEEIDRDKYPLHKLVFEMTFTKE